MNQIFAKRLFGTVDAVGMHFPSGPESEMEVVGGGGRRQIQHFD